MSGNYFGIPHIIGGKLTIIGGHLSATEQRTNKVSTFDEASQTWISYYPDMLSVRSKPGVVTHGEYVIVVGGARSDKLKQDENPQLAREHWMEESIHDTTCTNELHFINCFW